MKKSSDTIDMQSQQIPPFEFDSENGNRPHRAQYQKQIAAITETRQIIAKSMKALVLAYLAANLDYSHIPLKDFMAGLEKKLLLTCLRLTHGSQKNSAAILGIKPTVMFEKMRKHGISRQQVHLSGEWTESLMEIVAQDLTDLEINAVTCSKPAQELPTWQNNNRQASITSQIG